MGCRWGGRAVVWDAILGLGIGLGARPLVKSTWFRVFTLYLICCAIDIDVDIVRSMAPNIAANIAAKTARNVNGATQMPPPPTTRGPRWADAQAVAELESDLLSLPSWEPSDSTPASAPAPAPASAPASKPASEPASESPQPLLQRVCHCLQAVFLRSTTPQTTPYPRAVNRWVEKTPAISEEEGDDEDEGRRGA